MGGIAGLYYPAIAKPVDPARIVAMSKALTHRGPDGSGVWTAPGIGLGHRRLAIIDIEGGIQPLATPDQGVAVSFDGEIYNHQELRRELEGVGARFVTASDTEVLLHGWRAWGPNMLRRLNGIFAFALYDAGQQMLFLARDRMGVKPLVYAELADGAMAFASEIKGLLAHPLFRRTPDFRAVEDYVALGYVPDDASILSGVRKLPAGHFLLLRRGQQVPQPVRWWDIDFSKRAVGKAKDLEAELIEHMRIAVRSRMNADVPLGAFLSGDVDSSAVVALMAEASKAAIKTCAVEENDALQAAAIADRFATAHRTRRAAADVFALIDTLVEAFDEPFGDVAALPVYRMCELARERVTVAFTGFGADEALAGLDRHKAMAFGERARAAVPEKVRSNVFGTLARFSKTGRSLAQSGEFAYAEAVSVTPATLRQRLYTKSAIKSLGGHIGERRYVDTMRQAPARDGLDRAQYADVRHWLSGNILTRLDRTSMAVSLEAREPLLDHRLIEFAATLPPALRIKAGHGKWLMRKALEPYLPRDLLYRPKHRAVNPLTLWFRHLLAAEAAALAKSGLLANTGWFEMATIETLTAEHQSGRADHGRTLWQLLMLERSLARLFT